MSVCFKPGAAGIGKEVVWSALRIPRFWYQFYVTSDLSLCFTELGFLIRETVEVRAAPLPLLSTVSGVLTVCRTVMCPLSPSSASHSCMQPVPSLLSLY